MIKERHNHNSSQPPPDDNLSLAIYRMHLEHVLRQIQPDSCDLAHLLLLHRIPSAGDHCSDGAGPVHTIKIKSFRPNSSKIPPTEPSMADQIVITEKTSQAKDIRAAVGSRYGDVLPAEGHLFDLLEPEDVVPAWTGFESA